VEFFNTIPRRRTQGGAEKPAKPVLAKQAQGMFAALIGAPLERLQRRYSKTIFVDGFF